MKSFTLDELARMLGAEPSETPGPVITGVRPIEHAGIHDITYCASPRFLEKLAESAAGAVILPQGLDPGGRPCIRSRNPEADFARLTAVYYPYPTEPAGVSQKAEIHPEAVLGKDVCIAPFSVVGKGVVVGDRCVIGAHVVIGENVRIGDDTRIFPNVTLYHGVNIGSRVIIHSGSVIGSDGFGFCRDADETGRPVNIKKYQRGTVEIGDDVEIGALVAVDRALSGATRIGKGVKLDNLIQIAHNVEIGDYTVIASQVGIAGSSSVGRYGLIGGQAGIRDHVSVGDGVILATRVGIWRNVPDGSIMAGSVPAMPRQLFLRVQTLIKKLPEMLDRIRKLERILLSNRKDNQ
jgi:UDP-3-O-[3-hydroxymyristoyl] glucosamine N-acyltransferase